LTRTKEDNTASDVVLLVVKLSNALTLKKEAVHFSEAFETIYKSTRRQNGQVLN
jgi:hypothetical protein